MNGNFQSSAEVKETCDFDYRNFLSTLILCEIIRIKRCMAVASNNLLLLYALQITLLSMNSHKFYSTSTYHFPSLSLSLSLSLSSSLFSLMVFMVVSSFFYRCYIVNNTWTTTALLTYIRHKCISSWVDYTFKSYHRTCKNDTWMSTKRINSELKYIYFVKPKTSWNKHNATFFSILTNLNQMLAYNH